MTSSIYSAAALVLLATLPGHAASVRDREQPPSPLARLQGPFQAAAVTDGAPLRAEVGEGGCLYYGTQTGNTEKVARYIGAAMGGVDPVDIGDFDPSEAGNNCGSLILGAPTWNTGADDRMNFWLYDTLPNLDLAGKKCAVFGLGDQADYPKFFCNAAGEIYDGLVEKGCEMYGSTSNEGYYGQGSKAVRYVGLMLDEDNEPWYSEERVVKWVAQLRGEGFFSGQ